MANLIITVIAIALVALSALMGAYYGGAAFLNEQSDSQADSLLNMGTQAQAALQNYLMSNGNVPPTSWAQMVSQGDLTRVLVFPVLIGNNNGNNSGISLDGAGTYWLWGDIGLPNNGINDPSAAVCVDILKHAHGNAPSSVTTTGVNHTALTSNSTGNGVYGCVINSSALNDPGASNVMTDNPGLVPDGHYAFFYRLN